MTQEPVTITEADEAAHTSPDQPVVTHALIEYLHELLERGDTSGARALVCGMHEADQAEIFNQLGPEDNVMLARMLGDAFNHDVLPELESEVVEDILEGLGPTRSAEVFAALDSEDAVQIIEDLPREDQEELLGSLDSGTREELREGLSYPEESAGRMMRKKMVSIPEFWTVGDTIDFMRSHPDLPGDFYVVFVTDPKFRPIGEVHLARVMQNKRDVTIRDIMDTGIRAVHTDTDQEQVAYIFRKYGLVEAPVVNDDGRLVGTITVDDAVEVLGEEQEEDFMRAAGLYGQDMHASIMSVAPRRFIWLFINLLTAIAASAIIDVFEETIRQLVLLAVLMPIAASMGGNAGIQSATVAVRAIATRRLGPGSGREMMLREMIMGAINGLAIAAITGLGVYFVYADAAIAAVFAAAIVFTMTAAGLGGVFLPLLLTKLKVDPAISAGVFLTMLTDMVGFFSFLGLAALVL